MVSLVLLYSGLRHGDEHDVVNTPLPASDWFSKEQTTASDTGDN